MCDRKTAMPLKVWMAQCLHVCSCAACSPPACPCSLPLTTFRSPALHVSGHSPMSTAVAVAACLCDMAGPACVCQPVLRAHLHGPLPGGSLAASTGTGPSTGREGRGGVRMKPGVQQQAQLVLTYRHHPCLKQQQCMGGIAAVLSAFPVQLVEMTISCTACSISLVCQ
jgi:hypothetical protein